MGFDRYSAVKADLYAKKGAKSRKIGRVKIKCNDALLGYIRPRLSRGNFAGHPNK